MTTEEKLEHFYDISVESAKADATKELEDYKKSLANLLAEHKETKLRQAQLELTAESATAKRTINKALSAEQLHIKRKLSKKQRDLKEELFVEVKNLLEEFMGTPAYSQYLCTKIQEALTFADGDEVTFYLAPADAALMPSLVSQVGHELCISKESFFGGIKAMIPSKNILIDNSFSATYEAEKEEFTFDGGLLHE